MNHNRKTHFPLVVVDFDTKTRLTSAIEKWRDRHNVPYSMSCARQVWYGTPDDYSDFPMGEGIKRRDDAAAYAFLLSFASGFEYKDYSTHNRYQFFKAWREVQRAMPEVANLYKQLIRDIELDSNLVHNTIIKHYRKPLFDLSARDISGQKKGDTVLFLGSLSRNGNISDNTKRIIMATETKQKSCGSSDYITITHPEAETLEKIQEAIEYIKRNPTQNCAIRSEINFIIFDEVARAIEENNRVYVDIPQGSMPETEQEIIEMWRGRNNKNNTLTHLKGNPENRGLSDALWADAALDNYYTPEDIRTEVVRRKKLKKRIWERSAAMFEFCAKLRTQGVKPDKTLIRNDAPELISEFII